MENTTASEMVLADVDAIEEREMENYEHVTATPPDGPDRRPLLLPRPGLMPKVYLVLARDL